MTRFTLHTAMLAATLAAALVAPAAFGKTVNASSSGKSASKQNAPKTEKVELEGIRLITPEKEIEANVDTAEFTRFVDKVDTAVQYLMYGSPQPTTLILQFTCTPRDKSARLMVQGQPGEKLGTMMSQLKEALDAIDNMKVRSGKIEFTMQYKINP